MQVEPATALGLIQAGPLSNGTTVEPGAAHTYSAAVFGKLEWIALLCGVDVGQPLGLVQAEPAIVSGLIRAGALQNATAA
ncbi:hypothetical protein QL285_085719 [Trifolium repens]|nr:hypothetical protein QL285_085719 [Trifolium repens]